MSEREIPQHDWSPAACCSGGHDGEPCGPPRFNRRYFLAAGSAAAATVALPLWSAAAAEPGTEPQRRPPIRKVLRVQPIFQCEIYERKPATSWRVTGAIQNEQELQEEEAHVRRDLAKLAASADFPLEVLPLATVRNLEQAKAAAAGDVDAQVIYAARRNLPVLRALADNEKWNLMFVRHRSGPLYYMYIGAHAHFLRKGRDEFAQANMGVRDIVVDDQEELLWRLRAFAALKNVRQRRIVAVGGPGGWGADGASAPKRAQELWKLDIRTVGYPELGARIKRAQQDDARTKRCRTLADRYLNQQGVTLETSREFVDRAFLLTDVFRDLLDEAEADSITINSCMTTIMPVSETTACLPLSLLSDEGYLAFCESDFVAIPAGMLLHFISGNPVFFCNPSLPHRGVMTVSHCTAPRQMDGRRPEPTRILTHYESDYGAAPKVDMRKGQVITMINPDFAGQRWLGVTGEILDTPFFPICRTQLDVKLHGDWERLAEEIRGFHWMVAYGRHLSEVGYALSKSGLSWLSLY